VLLLEGWGPLTQHSSYTPHRGSTDPKDELYESGAILSRQNIWLLYGGRGCKLLDNFIRLYITSLAAMSNFDLLSVRHMVVHSPPAYDGDFSHEPVDIILLGELSVTGSRATE